MVSGRFWRLDRRGFSMAELVAVMAIITIVTAGSAPFLISYWRAATLKAGAEELAAGLNQARQLAIARNRNVCVVVVSSRYRYCLDGCACDPADTIWKGAGTDANGFFWLQNGVALVTNANPVFTYLGAAAPAATFTVTNPQGSANLSVVVSASGRIQVQ